MIARYRTLACLLMLSLCGGGCTSKPKATAAAAAPKAPSPAPERVRSQGPFVTVWKGDQITIPAGEGTFLYDVDWDNDGTYDEIGVTGPVTHAYGTPGPHTVAIRGQFPHFTFYEDPTSIRYGNMYLHDMNNMDGDLDGYVNAEEESKKLIAVESWGEIPWESMEGMFAGCTYLEKLPASIPDLSRVTSTRAMFYGAVRMNSPHVGAWDTSRVEDMSLMFSMAVQFDQTLEHWDVSSVTTMEDMFNGALAFDQPLDTWDVSRVEDMSGMFSRTGAFNQPLGSWDTGRVKSMWNMFGEAGAFDQPIAAWDVSQVTSMGHMFYNTYVFNQPLGQWDTSKVTDMENMFSFASRFDRGHIGSWDLSRVSNAETMFSEDIRY